MTSSPDLLSRQMFIPRPLAGGSDRSSPGAALVDGSLLERELEDRLRRRLFVLGHSAVRQGLMALAVFATVFAVLTGPRLAVFIWAALVLCVLLARLYFLDQNLRVYPAPEYAQRQPAGNWRYFGPYAATSAAWSLGPWFLVPLGPIPTEWLALLAVFMSGLMTGPVPVIVPSRTAAHVWLLPLALGMAARSAVHGGMVGWTLCTYILVYAAVALRFALQQNELARGSALADREGGAVAAADGPVARPGAVEHRA